MNEFENRLRKQDFHDSMHHMSEEFPIAMAYFRRQELDQMYNPEFALDRGTLFPELDKPFCGKTVTGGKR